MNPADNRGLDDANDWWDGTVELASASDEQPTGNGTAVPAGDSTAASRAAAGGSSAAADGVDDGARPNIPRRWLLGASVVVLVSGIAVLVAGLVARDDGSPAAADEDSEGGPAGDFGGFGLGTSGRLADLDPSSATLVVETSSGETIEVATTDVTSISETVEGSADDLAVGDDILVTGTESQGGDGEIAAMQIIVSETGLLGDAGSFGGSGLPNGDDMPQVPEGGFPDGEEVPAGPDGGQAPGGFTTGTIESVDDGSITMHTADDDTVVLTVSSSTNVLRSLELSFDDLAPGDAVTVVGKTDDGGDVVTAVSIRRGDAGITFGGGFPGDDLGGTT